MTEAEKAYQYFVIAVPENEEQAKAYFWARKALQSTLTQPNEWVSVYDRLPESGERVLATDCGFVGEFYINKRGKWQRYNVNCSELLMALDILYWMPLPAPPRRLRRHGPRPSGSPANAVDSSGGEVAGKS